MSCCGCTLTQIGIKIVRMHRCSQGPLKCALLQQTCTAWWVICKAWVLQTCVLAGCDFVKALPGIGVKKAHSQMRRLKAIAKVLPKPLRCWTFKDTEVLMSGFFFGSSMVSCHACLSLQKQSVLCSHGPTELLCCCIFTWHGEFYCLFEISDSLQTCNQQHAAAGLRIRISPMVVTKIPV